MITQTEILTELVGHFLIATPHMSDERFHQAVIYMCSHDHEGAMGLVINQPAADMQLDDLLGKLNQDPARFGGDETVFNGGPVEPKRGYILHSADHLMPDSITINEDVALSMQVEMVVEIGAGLGPQHHKIMLGHTGWGPGQLEEEMVENMWLHVPAEPNLVFDCHTDHLWHETLAMRGFNAGNLSPLAGRA